MARFKFFFFFFFFLSSFFFSVFFFPSCFLLCFSQCLFFLLLFFSVSQFHGFSASQCLFGLPSCCHFCFVVGFCGLLVCLFQSFVVVLLCYCFSETEHFCPLSASVYILCPCLSVIAGMVVTSAVTDFFPRFDDSIRLTSYAYVVLLPNVKYLSAVQNMCPIPTVPIIQLLSKRFSSTRGTKFRLLSCPFLFQQTRHQLDLFLALRQYPIIVDELHRK